ncbi:MAG: hypothetical protein GTO46_15800 [Gemmatimonadetes bacterium]|nr:hypothetical protein [Gemmatimonadota bacterium]NIO33100.1 hypothetical protein [Gemmatimonadota bacterium]
MATVGRGLLVVGTLAAAAGCGSLAAVPSRLEPIPYADTLPSERPAAMGTSELERLLDVSVSGEIGHALSVRRLLGAEHEALNITRFDDVVNSAWFEHRNGRRHMSPEEVARGPTSTGPDTSNTLTVIGGKTAGISPGFTVRDARGDTFLFKFDPKGNLQLASAAGVISSRLFWAAGYHTPEDVIVVFDAARLQLDPDAEIETKSVERPMTAEDIYLVLDGTDKLPDGRYLALASKYVPGRPLGPFLFSGVRSDDPNDWYRHEYRRELRGLYVISSWLNHVDMRFANTLDVFIDPPGYVRHYLIDFAATLGSGTIRSHKPREGTEYNFDIWATLGRVFTFGFLEVGWEEHQPEEIHPTLGWLPVDSFDPGKWKPNWPNEAFNKRTPRDGYWGAKLVSSFDDEQIAAAVGAGRLPEEAAQALTDILIRRRDMVVSHWYAQVTPIENVETTLNLDADPARLELSFDDLGLNAGVWGPGETRYIWRFADPATGTRSRGDGFADSGDRQVINLDLRRRPGDAPSAEEDFAILRIVASREGVTNRAATVYLRWDGREYRVVGLEH